MQPNAINLPNISAIEILTIKRFLIESLETLDKLMKPTEEDGPGTQDMDDTPAQGNLRRYRQQN